MADVGNFTTWSSTAASNTPTGPTTVGTGLAPNLQQIQAEIAKWRDGMGYGTLTVTGVAGTANAITGNTSPAPTLTTNQKFLLVPTATNTAATTLALNSGAAKNVYAGNSALVGGELHASIPVLLEYDGTQFQLLGPIFKQATRQTLTSGSGATYTTPTGATRIYVRMVGGGGGGGGSGTDAAQTSGGAGGNTTFSTFTAGGGGGGGLSSASGTGVGGAGGTASGGSVNIVGGTGSTGAGVLNQNATGGAGGSSAFGGAGGSAHYPNVSRAAAANSGSGGSGVSGNANVYGAAGGGAGGYVEALVVGPAATYTYTVGAAGTAGGAGANGVAGALGAAGIIIVDEWYN